MAAFLFSRGIVKQGHLHAFVRGVREILEYRRRRAYCVPEVLYGLSGPMNTMPAARVARANSGFSDWKP